MDRSSFRRWWQWRVDVPPVLIGGMMLAVAILWLLAATGNALGWFGWSMVCGLLGLLAFPPTALLAAREVPRGPALARREASAITLTCVAAAVRGGLPITTMLRGEVRGERNRAARRQMSTVADALEAGRSLGAALGEVDPPLPPRAARIIAAAHRTGRLDHHLPRLAADCRSKGGGDDSWVTPLRYPVLVLLLCVPTFLYLGAFIVPKFRKITADFRIAPPAALDGLAVGLHRWNDGTVFLLLMALAAGAWGVSILLRATPPDGWVCRVRDGIGWRVPILGAALRSRELAGVCEILADALEAGVPADRALAAAGERSSNSVLRRRMAVWRTRVRDGEALGAAAERAGLPSILSGLLATCHGGDAPERALGFVGAHCAARARVAEATARVLLVGLALLPPSLLVLWAGGAIVGTLAELIAHLARTVWTL